MTRIDRAGRARFCESCERPVYDSQALTHGELADLIARHEGRQLPCVRLHRRPDGTIVTRDCFAPFLRAGRFLWLRVALGAVAFWAWALGFRPLAQSVRRHVAQREATRLEIDDRAVDIQGVLITIRHAPPDRPPSWPTWGTGPVFGIRALLPGIAAEKSLRFLEGDEDIQKRLEPDRPPPPDPSFP